MGIKVDIEYYHKSVVVLNLDTDRYETVIARYKIPYDNAPESEWVFVMANHVYEDVEEKVAYQNRKVCELFVNAAFNGEEVPYGLLDTVWDW